VVLNHSKLSPDSSVTLGGIAPDYHLIGMTSVAAPNFFSIFPGKFRENFGPED